MRDRILIFFLVDHGEKFKKNFDENLEAKFFLKRRSRENKSLNQKSIYHDFLRIFRTL